MEVVRRARGRGGEVRHPARDSGRRRTRPARGKGIDPLRRTVPRVAGVRVHRRGLFGVVDGDDGVDGPDEEVAALGLVELEAVDASRPLVREGLVPAQRRSVHATTRDTRRERRGSRATELATAKLVARRVPTPGRRHAVRRERAAPLCLHQVSASAFRIVVDDTRRDGNFFSRSRPTYVSADEDERENAAPPRTPPDARTSPRAASVSRIVLASRVPYRVREDRLSNSSARVIAKINVRSKALKTVRRLRAFLLGTLGARRAG